MNLSKTTIENYLKKLSSDSPVPSAGVALSLTGAMGVSLLVMASRVTVSKKADADLQHFDFFILQANERVKELLALGEKDMANYRGFLRKEKSPEEIIEAPLEIARICAKILGSYRKIYPGCHPPVKGEAKAGMELLKTTVKESINLVQINLKHLREEEKEKYLQYKNKIREILVLSEERNCDDAY